MRRVVPIPLVPISLTALLFLAVSAFLPPTARAAVPGTLHFQGVLKTPSGAPVADGLHVVTFSLYNGALSATSVWSESLKVNTTQGIFSTTLGTVKAITPAMLTGDDWLEISLGTDVLSPRQRLTTTPYALTTSTIDGAVGGSISGAVIASGTVYGTGASFTLFSYPITLPGIQGTGVIGTGGDAPGVRAIGSNSGTGLGLEVQGSAHVTKDLTVDGNAATGPLSVHGHFSLDGSMDTPFGISAEGQIDAWGGLSSHHDISATYDVKSRTVHADHVYATGLLAPDYDTGIKTLNPGANAGYTITAFVGGDVSNCFVDAQEVTETVDGSERAYKAPENFHVVLFQGLTSTYARLVVYWNVPGLNSPIKYRVRVWKQPA